ncbi:MAG: hypothetical protein GC159_09415 [Phycisphaera sp.]|nr:hypothetical protein [Phycisphaera sp.]
MRFHHALRTVAALGLIAGAAINVATAAAADQPLPDAKPIPATRVIPLPDDQASVVHNDRELTRYRFAPDLHRPYWYPIIGPSGVSHTRMGHPHDPFTHSHHNSVWISHHDINGIDFWSDHAKDAGRIVCQMIREYHDADDRAFILSINHWVDASGAVQMIERRRSEVVPLEGDAWLMYIDLELEAPKGKPVTIGQNPFGVIGVRMAKSIGVNDGGGRILNSDGGVNEQAIFRKPAKWVDYSGRVTNDVTGGVTLMDHPTNINHPAPFHVRNDGWMGACLTLDKPLVIEPDKPLHLRYGLWVHAGVPDVNTVAKVWDAFSKTELPAMEKTKR